MAHDVFISHSSKDKTIADAVCARLEARGIRCWIAPRDVQPGLPYGEAIIDGIHNCKIMVLLLSSSANNSIHIAKEVERAVSHGATVIPLRIEAVMPGKSLDYFIGSVHWLDALTPPLENHLDNLAQTILKILPPKEALGPVEVPPPIAPPKVVATSSPFPPPAPTVFPVAATAPAPAPVLQKRKWLIPAIVGGGVLLVAVVAIVATLTSGGGNNTQTGGNTGGNSPAAMVPVNPTPGGKRTASGDSTAADAVVGCWQWFNSASVVIRSNGLMTAGPFTAEWRSVDSSRRIYNFIWPEAVDTTALSLDGRTLSGGNQYGYKMSATRLAGGPGLPGTWRWYNGVVVAIQTDGSFAAGNVSGHWRGAGFSYSLTWPKPVDTVTLSSDHNRIDGHNQFGIHISGTRSGGCGS